MPKLPDRKRNWAYANGNLGKSALASTMDVFALYYLTTVLMMPGPVAGGMLLATMIWDAFTDPIVGLYADRERSRHDTATPYFVIGAPLTVAAFLLFFTVQFLPPSWAWFLSALALLGFRTGYALIDVPHNGLLVAIAPNSVARTNVSSMRIFFSALGKFAVTALASWLLIGSQPTGANWSFLWMALAMAILFVASMAVCARAVHGIKLHLEPANVDTTERAQLVRTFRANAGIRTMFALTAINSLMTPGIAITMVYVARYELGDAAIGAQAVLIQSIGQALSLLAWNWVTHRSGNRIRILIFAYVLLAIVALASVGVGLGSPTRMFMLGLFSGVAMGGISMLNWALLPDALEQARRHSGTSAFLSLFGLYTIVNKAFQGLGQGLAGVLLGLIGFSATAGFPSRSVDTYVTTILAVIVGGCLVCIFALRSTRTLFDVKD